MGKRTQYQKDTFTRDKTNADRSRKSAIIATAMISSFITSIIFLAVKDKESSSPPSVTIGKNADTLDLIDGLLSFPGISDQTDIAFLNLATAPGLTPTNAKRSSEIHSKLLINGQQL